MTTNNSWNAEDPVQVAKGGSGVATHTAYAPICGGTTATGAVQSVASVGTAGQVLASNGAGALPSFQGSLNTLQIASSSTGSVVACTTILPNDDTIPQNTEGDEVLTVSITPNSASSTLYISVVVQGSASVVTTTAMAVFVDSTADALSAAVIDNTAGGINGAMAFTLSSGSTSARTYKLRCGPSTAATFNVNGTGAGVRRYGGVGVSTLTVMEID